MYLTLLQNVYNIYRSWKAFLLLLKVVSRNDDCPPKFENVPWNKKHTVTQRRRRNRHRGNCLDANQLSLKLNASIVIAKWLNCHFVLVQANIFNARRNTTSWKGSAKLRLSPNSESVLGKYYTLDTFNCDNYFQSSLVGTQLLSQVFITNVLNWNVFSLMNVCRLGFELEQQHMLTSCLNQVDVTFPGAAIEYKVLNHDPIGFFNGFGS